MSLTNLASQPYPYLKFSNGSVADPLGAFPFELSFDIFCNLDDRDLFAASHVSRRWRCLAIDDHLWARRLAARWRCCDDPDPENPSSVVGVTPREKYYEQAKLFLSFADGICDHNLMPTVVEHTTESRFGKITRLDSAYRFKISIVANQVPPGTYEIYWRVRFAADALSNCGIRCRATPLKIDGDDESCFSSSDLHLTPYCVFLYRNNQWLLVRSHTKIVIPEAGGPRDVCLELFSSGTALNRAMDFDYIYIRDVTTSYFNERRDSERPYQDGPIPKRLDMLNGSDDPPALPRISAAF